MSILNRHEIRVKAIQSLYQLTNPKYEFNSDQAVQFALEAGDDPEDAIQGEVDAYLIQLVRGVNENRQAIDEMIKEYLISGWHLDRIANIDLTILRLAFYEVVFINDDIVPNRVAVDEAIELSKSFSDENSRKFVSGVLAKLLANQ